MPDYHSVALHTNILGITSGYYGLDLDIKISRKLAIGGSAYYVGPSLGVLLLNTTLDIVDADAGISVSGFALGGHLKINVTGKSALASGLIIKPYVLYSDSEYEFYINNQADDVDGEFAIGYKEIFTGVDVGWQFALGSFMLIPSLNFEYTVSSTLSYSGSLSDSDGSISGNDSSTTTGVNELKSFTSDKLSGAFDYDIKVSIGFGF